MRCHHKGLLSVLLFKMNLYIIIELLMKITDDYGDDECSCCCCFSIQLYELCIYIYILLLFCELTPSAGIAASWASAGSNG